MGLWRRRRKQALTVLSLALLGGVSAFLWWRNQVPEYQPGEETEGLVDRLARHVPEDHPKALFTEVSAELGVEFAHFPGVRRGHITEDMGSGLALGDVDSDGWTDMYLVGAARTDAPADERAPSRLMRNLGERFEDVTAASGIDEGGLGMAAAFVDVDSDGDLDLATTRVGGLGLWRNNGGLVFEDVAREAGLADRRGFWAGIGVGDHGGDGDLDLYICGYIDFDEDLPQKDEPVSQYKKVISAMINPSAFDPIGNLFFENDGSGGFTERAVELGIDNPTGRSLGVVFSDLNADGTADLYVANDVSDNALLLGDGAGGFVDATSQALVGDYRGAMGLAAGDVDDDLDLDLFVTHWVGQENALYTQYRFEEQPNGGPRVPVFIDSNEAFGLGHEALDKVGWATHLFDYDNDGLRDLLVINGSTIPLDEDVTQMEPMRSQLFWKHPRRRGFYEVGAVAGDFFREPHVGRGGAGFDFDLDGDEDLAVMLHGEGLALLRNDGGDAGAALRVRLRQPTGNRFAIGTRVELIAGELHSMAIVGSDGSYLSQHAVGELHFGLGAAPLVDRLLVTWPDGTIEEAGPFTPRSLVTWERGQLPTEVILPGRLAHGNGRPADARVEVEFFALRKRAITARLDGDLEQAARLYRDALVLWPGHGDCSYYLGHCLLGLGRELEALRAYTRRIAFEPEASSSWIQIGLLHLPGGDPSLDDLDLAEAAFGRSHALNKEEARSTLLLGHVATLRGDHELARSRYLNAVAHNPRSVEARWFAGREAWLAGEPEQAAALLEEALQLATTAATSESATSEGDTKVGGAMTSDIRVPLIPLLTRWTSLAERDADPAREYAQDQL